MKGLKILRTISVDADVWQEAKSKVKNMSKHINDLLKKDNVERKNKR